MKSMFAAFIFGVFAALGIHQTRLNRDWT